MNLHYILNNILHVMHIPWINRSNNDENELKNNEFNDSDYELDESEPPISDNNNNKYCQFGVIILRILYQLLHIKNDKFISIQNYIIYNFHIERLYSDLVWHWN